MATCAGGAGRVEESSRLMDLPDDLLEKVLEYSSFGSARDFAATSRVALAVTHEFLARQHSRYAKVPALFCTADIAKDATNNPKAADCTSAFFKTLAKGRFQKHDTTPMAPHKLAELAVQFHHYENVVAVLSPQVEARYKQLHRELCLLQTHMNGDQIAIAQRAIKKEGPMIDRGVLLRFVPDTLPESALGCIPKDAISEECWAYIEAGTVISDSMRITIRGRLLQLIGIVMLSQFIDQAREFQESVGVKPLDCTGYIAKTTALCKWLDSPGNRVFVDAFQSLDLSSQGYSKIPREFLPFTRVGKLVLSHNKLADLSDLSNFPKVATAEVSHNCITTLSSSLTRHPALKTLRVEGNPILFVPQATIEFFREEGQGRSIDIDLELFQEENMYEATSRLGHLYKQFMKEPLTIKDIKEAFEALNAEEKRLVCEMFCLASEKPVKYLLCWEETLDLGLLGIAVKKAIIAKFEHAPTEEKEAIQKKLHELGAKRTDLPERVVSRLADAISV